MALNYQQDWENLAQLSPEWAILSDPKKQQEEWDKTEFFAVGEKDINELSMHLKELNIELNFDEALDFGCGIGRLTRAIAKHFNKVYGLDISPTMLQTAKEINGQNPKMIFLQNNQNDLASFSTDKFDLVISLITLQHIPDKEIIKKFILEFLRVLKPGGVLYIQLPSTPSFSKLKNTLLKLRGNLYYFLTKIGIAKEYCFQKRIMPFMYMNYLSKKEIESIFDGTAKILQTYDDNSINQRYLVQKYK
ncbi:class I SAM-dependent methyltransferase [Patescibacteria group bacterium]|nr:class I SAM-dependent methyltransferase [Patescibacteria group bacterium]